MIPPLRILSTLLLLLCIQVQAGCASSRLDDLTYEEAVEAYRATSRFENYRCIHLMADGDYRPVEAAKPIAIEIDDVLYLKLDGRLYELAQTAMDETEANYGASTGELEAGYTIIRQFNHSEYGESDDRHVDFWVKTPDGKQSFKTFGNRCGV